MKPSLWVFVHPTEGVVRFWWRGADSVRGWPPYTDMRSIHSRATAFRTLPAARKTLADVRAHYLGFTLSDWREERLAWVDRLQLVRVEVAE